MRFVRCATFLTCLVWIAAHAAVAQPAPAAEPVEQVAPAQIAPAAEPADAQTAATASAAASTMPAGVEDDVPPPFLFAVILLVGVVVLILIGVGVVAGLAVIGGTIALVLLGVLSTSLFVGVKERRIESGLRAFALQLAAVTGAVLGGLTFWLGAYLLKVDWPISAQLIAGLLIGAGVGTAVGLLLNLAWGKARAWLIGRAEARSSLRVD